MPTEREQAMKRAIEAREEGGQDTPPALDLIFLLILETLKFERQDLRDRYFEGLRRAFPIEFRMCEAWLIDEKLTEFPDFTEGHDLLHWMEERHLQFVESERRIGPALDAELQEILAIVGPTADPELAPPEQPGSEFDSDLWGGIPN